MMSLIFFETTHSKFSSLFERLGSEFGNAYSSRGNKSDSDAGGSYYARYIRRNKSRIAELVRITKGNLSDFEKLEKMSIWQHNVVKDELIQMLKGKK